MSNTLKIRRALVETPQGAVHVRRCGEGPPLLLLHQTADSSREFLKIMPILGEQFSVIAMDTMGYGDSDPIPVEWEMADFAASVAATLDGLGIERCALLGNHTGATIALEFCTRYPARARALVANGLTLWDETEKARLWDILYQPIEPHADGSHLGKYWEKARYASDPPLDIHQRGFLDVAKSPDMLAAYRAVFNYDIESRIGLVECPTLVIAGEHDPMGAFSERAARLLQNGRAVTIPGAKFFLADLHTAEYMAAVQGFLSHHLN